MRCRTVRCLAILDHCISIIYAQQITHIEVVFIQINFPFILYKKVNYCEYWILEHQLMSSQLDWDRSVSVTLDILINSCLALRQFFVATKPVKARLTNVVPIDVRGTGTSQNFLWPSKWLTFIQYLTVAERILDSELIERQFLLRNR